MILERIETGSGNGQVRMKTKNIAERHTYGQQKLGIKNPQSAPPHIDGDPRETSAAFEIEIIERR